MGIESRHRVSWDKNLFTFIRFHVPVVRIRSCEIMAAGKSFIVNGVKST